MSTQSSFTKHIMWSSYGAYGCTYMTSGHHVEVLW